MLFCILYVFICSSIEEGNKSDYEYSLYYVILSVFSLYIIWRNFDGKLSLFFLFVITFNLFIGGRFYVRLFDSSLDVFTPTFFYDYFVDSSRKLSLMRYVYCYLFFLTFANSFFCLIKIKCPFGEKINNLGSNEIGKLSRWLYPILGLCLLYISISAAINAYQNGYAIVETYVTDKSYSVSILGKFAPMLLIIMVGLVYAYHPQLVKRYLFLYFFYAFCVLLGGARATFGSIMLIALWLYSLRYKISILKIALYGVSGLIVLLVIFSFSSRGSGLENFSIGDGIKIFFWQQGISLMVFDASRFYTDYPLVACLQNFIPGISFVLSKFTHLFPQDATLSGYMCYNLNAKLYANGLGLGWTTLSDIYVYSKGNLFFFSFLSFILGGIITILETWSLKNRFFLYLLISIAPGLLMMSRGYISGIFIQPYYSIIFVLIFVLIFRVRSLRIYCSE